MEEAAHVGELRRVEPGVAAERAPGAFDQLGGGEAGTLAQRLRQHVPDARHPLAGVVREQMAALGDEAQNGVVFEGGIVGAGESVQSASERPHQGARRTARAATRSAG